MAQPVDTETIDGSIRLQALVERVVGSVQLRGVFKLLGARLVVRPPRNGAVVVALLIRSIDRDADPQAEAGREATIFDGLPAPAQIGSRPVAFATRVPPAKMIDLEVSTTVTSGVFTAMASPEDAVMEDIGMLLQDMLLHECDEGLFVNGKRRRDPHADDPVAP